MANHRGHDGAKARRALFSAADRAKIMQLVVGKPSGTLVTIGGIEFDIVPFNTTDGMELFELSERVGELWGKARASALEEAEVGAAIKAEGSRVLKLMRTALEAAAFIEDDEQQALFDDWFAKLPLIESVRTLAPALIAANGINALRGNASPPAAPTEPTAETASE